MRNLFVNVLGIVLILNFAAFVQYPTGKTWIPLLITLGMLATFVLMLIILGIQHLANMEK